VPDEPVTLGRPERLAHGAEKQAVAARTLDAPEDDLAEVSEPTRAEAAVALELEVIPVKVRRSAWPAVLRGCHSGLA
jgi:hypothetical protein